MPNQTNSELGRELKADELLVRTVVVLRRDDRDVMFTAWVLEVGETYAAFYCDEIYTSYVCSRCSDDLSKLIDPHSGLQIHVYEFLGDYEGKPTAQ